MRRLILTALLLCCGLAAQSPIASQVGTLGDSLGAWLFYENGDRAFTCIDDGGLTTTVLKGASTPTETEEVDRDSTTLVTKWKDKKYGLEHEVRTTYHGQKEGSRKAASQRHKAAVLLELEAWPPA
jgi:hypothetical protein